VTTPYIGPGQHPAAWISAAIPSPLMRALERRGGIPHTVRGSLTQQLEDGIPPQRLRDRIERRWFLHHAHTSGSDLLVRADEIALQLVAPPECRPGCEDGWMLDDSGSCAACKPNGTRVDITGNESDGPRSSPTTYGRAAASVRNRMRDGRRSLQAAEERAHAEHDHVPVQRDERGRRIPVTAICAGCREEAVPVLRQGEDVYCRPCVGSCLGCSKVHPLTSLEDAGVCAACSL